MAQITGKVFKVYEKTFSGKVNYSIKLEDDPVYYRANQKRFAGIAEPGNTVTFEAELNDDGKSARITSDVRKAAAAQAAATPVSGGARETSIHYQSARKDALAFVQLAVQTEAISLGKTPKGKLAVLEAALDRYTAQFYEDIATLGAVARLSESEGDEASEDGEESGDEE